MPPFLPRKRLAPSPPPFASTASPKKPRLADALDAEARNSPSVIASNPVFLGDSDSDSSLSDVSSDEFEDVPTIRVGVPQEQEEDEDEDEDEDIEWEDAAPDASSSKPHHAPVIGDIQLTFRKDNDIGVDYGSSATAAKGKKGPTKRERHVRIQAHCMHVQFLLYHNYIRNKWICDKEVQASLVKQLPPQIKKEVEKWRVASGLPPEQAQPPKSEAKAKSKRQGKEKATVDRNERDWGQKSQKLEPGKPNMIHGDPLVTLMKVLSAFWKKKFVITAPGLRKRGYGTPAALKQEIVSFRKDEHDPERHGERINDLKEFRALARKCQGSRDVGAQLFTALCRGSGIESRLVASLQPTGFGWTKAEQSNPRKLVEKSNAESSSDSSEGDDISTIATKKMEKTPKAAKASSRSKRHGKKETPINLDSDAELKEELSGEDSVVDLTAAMPKNKPTRFDRDLAFPIYWTEAVSPISQKVLPVSPLVLASPVASTPEILLTFEPRGAKADKAKQVMAYVVAYSSDGTAKDVTVRYLRKRVWPGKTKGLRMPIEKVPIYNKHGKVKRHDEYDWFKHSMSSYRRTESMRTAVDHVEDSTDLIALELEKGDNKDEGDTLQSLKSSADFVLERHLRREEALRPNAKVDRMFISGKGDNIKQEPVYRRSDVERCLTTESWHKEGRRPKEGEAPMKFVPVRAVTLTRKREAEEHERQTGEKQTQGLYSWDQTEYIIPPPIKDGVIPKNAYGNMDCFVPSMVPKGAVHIPLRGTVRICKKLEIDFAEAVTGFEFGNKRAVPVCTGVVVATENAKLVRDAWKKYNEEQRVKEEGKLEKLVLDMWRKFVMGLRIRERVNEDYGEEENQTLCAEDIIRRTNAKDPIDIDDDEPHSTFEDPHEEMGGGFLLPHEEDLRTGGELIIEQQAPEPTRNTSRLTAETQYPTPSSMPPQKSTQRRNPKLTLQVSEDSSELSDLSENSEIQLRTLPSRIPSKASKHPPQIDDHASDSSADSDSVSFSDAVSGSESSDKDSRADTKALTSSSSDPTASSTASSEIENEEYTPRSTRTRDLKKSATSAQRAIQTKSGRKLRARREQPSIPTVAPKRARRARGAERKKLVVTSPYFDHHERSS